MVSYIVSDKKGAYQKAQIERARKVGFDFYWLDNETVNFCRDPFIEYPQYVVKKFPDAEKLIKEREKEIFVFSPYEPEPFMMYPAQALYSTVVAAMATAWLDGEELVNRVSCLRNDMRECMENGDRLYNFETYEDAREWADVLLDVRSCIQNEHLHPLAIEIKTFSDLVDFHHENMEGEEK